MPKKKFRQTQFEKHNNGLTWGLEIEIFIPLSEKDEDGGQPF